MEKKLVSAIVLAGGGSKRMGRNKALLKLGKKTMIETIVDTLKPLFNEIIVVTNNPEEYSMLKNVRFIPDCMEIKEKNSLIGLYSGVLASKNHFTFVVPCDMPLLNPSFIQYMLENLGDEDIMIPYLKGHYQPLHAIYGKGCLKPIKLLLEKENYKIINFFNDVVVTKIEKDIVKKFDPHFKSFLNINTDEEYKTLKTNILFSRLEEMEYIKKVKIQKINNGEVTSMEDTVIVEYPFTIFLNGDEFITLLCSPSGLEYLAVGFLVSEGIIKSKNHIEKISLDEEKGHIYIDLTKKTDLAEKLFGKRTVTTGCGKGTVFYNVLDSLGTQPIKSDMQIKAESILNISTQLNQNSELFKETGGVHSCALCGEDEILMFHEDVGRHNALDKIVGEAFLKDILLEEKILITSGRVSSEMIIKTAKRKIPILVSRSAPTDLSVSIAKELGVTLLGFARGRRMNIYHGENRIVISVEDKM